MGTKLDRFDESTKITSSSEIDEILKQARSAPALEDVDDDDDVGDFSERTQIGNVAELVARSMTIEDPAPPPPVVARTMSSQNVIRRPGTPSPVRRSEPMHAVRVSEPMPAVRAQGSLSDITPVAADDDDIAFDPWEEKPVKTISQPLPIVTPDVEEEAPAPVMALPLPMPEPEAPTLHETQTPAMHGVQAPPAIHALQAMHELQATPATAPRRGVRWGVIAWCMLLAAMIGAGTVGYMRIAQLEDELARAKIELKRANAR